MVYYDADLSFINGTDNITASDSNLGLFDTFNPVFSDPAADGVWDIRGTTDPNTMNSDGFGSRPAGTDQTAEQSLFASGGRGAENSPELVHTLSGLTGSTSYDVYAVYWSATNANWTLRAGLASNPGANTLFSRTGATVGGQSSTTGLVAGSAFWDTPPGPNSDAGLFTEGNRQMLLGLVGTASSTPGGNLEVFIDDASTAELAVTDTNRTWYEGIALAPAGSMVVSNAALDLDTGILDFFFPAPFASYSVTSASGSLDAAQWNSITNGTNSSLDSDPWVEDSDLDTELTESETPAVDGVQLSNSIDLGPIWRNSPFEDLLLSVTLADSSVVNIPISTTGTGYDIGDLDTDRDIDIDDYEILISNLHKTIDTNVDDTDLEQYLLGDLTGDAAVDYDDLIEFQELFALANPGQSLFATNVVPEPSSLLLVLVGACTLGLCRHRKLIPIYAYAGAVAILLASASSPVLAQTSMFDVDGEGGQFGPTLTGFTSVIGMTTAMDGNGVSLTLSGNIAGRGRDRGTAATNLGEDNNDNQVPDGDFAALYQDFVFLGVGETLTVGFTGLTPNQLYDVTAWSYDSGAFNGNAEDIAVNQNFLVGSDILANLSYEGDLAGGIGPDPDTSTLDDYAASFQLTADSSGNATFTTISSGTQGVRLNGVQLEPGLPPEFLTLEVDRGLGTVKILNDNPSPIDFDYYQITSPDGSLNVAGWNSLDDQESEPDPFNSGWNEAGGSSNDILSEVRGIGEGDETVAATNGTLSLGSAFIPGGAETLLFQYGLNGDDLITGIVNYVGVAPEGLLGDFNGDNTVNLADYTVWRNNLGASDSVLAPGSTNDGSGTVDAADYLTWKSNFGASSGALNAVSSAPVPEPSAILLILAGLAAICSRKSFQLA